MGFLLGLFLVCMLSLISASILPGRLNFLSFSESFSILFGNQNIRLNGADVQISLTNSTGSGFKSRLLYGDAFFSASIKLPANNYTAGVVVTFYTSNSDIFNNNHDELDFEFLGHIQGEQWVLQTNFFGNGSVQRSREERYDLWFDPTKDFHTYSFIWNKNWTVFYVDDVPLRQVHRVDAMGGDYPSKPMSLYATIWDGSDWATEGGKYKIDYRYAPFTANYTDFAIYGSGCYQQNIQSCMQGITSGVTNFRGLEPYKLKQMKDFRRKFMFYSYCDDRRRYPTPLPECTAANA
ncbi:xyloglucan endotransglucosylase/hydrolase 30, xyloglucan endotransglycosylase 4 [Hibiscus trionum]|uniref:Xyloglucan endotransglucosylase/hydrolase n=1 Tax=Hibiscus trionum TaxID=183268 RepID=A0A9W7H9H9_HIBTR|nr:xyloglucan endotransglucosylase/hydrolase 30, xyloglucan endotransglycosylase 4 [Hibiscus trionum]